MTHTLHRQGSANSLKDDFPVLAMPAKQFDLRDEETKERVIQGLKSIACAMHDHGPVLMGSPYLPGTTVHGLTIEAIVSGIKSVFVLHATYDDIEKLEKLLSQLSEREIGLSVTVSGLVADVFEVCDRVGLQPHTVSLSLGVWGKRALLPVPDVLEIVSMCGHAMISASRVEEALQGVRNGTLSPEEAATMLALSCVCGCFNTKRAARLIQEAASSR